MPVMLRASRATTTVDPVSQSVVDSLTDREREVFLALARGLSNAEIGEALFVSESTVKTHVGRVLAKLGARDRIHAVILAHRLGLVDDRDPLPET